MFAAGGCAADAEVDVAVVPQRPDITTLGGTSSGGTKRHVVVFKSETLPSDATARIQSAGGKVRKLIGSIGVATVDADGVAAARLAADSTVALVGLEHSWTLPKDITRPAARPARPAAPTPSGFLWGAQWDQRRVHAPEAWNNVSAQAQANVTVAVIDTGVMSDHPDLDGQVVYTLTTNYSSLLGCDAGAPPLPGAYPLYFTRMNLVTGNLCEQEFSPDLVIQPHGTHVAGTIAAKGEIGVAGVGPKLKIAAYKVFDRVVIPAPPPPPGAPPPPPGAPPATIEILTAFEGPMFAAVVDAANRGIPVVNMSLGGIVDRADPQGKAAYEAWNRVAKLAKKQGTLIVAAAGNESLNTNGTIASLPADLPSVLSVSATGSSNLQGPWNFPPTPENPIMQLGPIDAAPGSDVLAFYSNLGSKVDIAAPGGDLGPFFNPQTGENAQLQYLVLSTVPGFDPSQGALVADWAWFAGTSMAAPHVAGVAGLVKARHPAWSAEQIRARVVSTATKVGHPKSFGAGMVDADLATR